MGEGELGPSLTGPGALGARPARQRDVAHLAVHAAPRFRGLRRSSFLGWAQRAQGFKIESGSGELRWLGVSLPGSSRVQR